MSNIRHVCESERAGPKADGRAHFTSGCGFQPQIFEPCGRMPQPLAATRASTRGAEAPARATGFWIALVVIAGAAVWAALNRERLDPSAVEAAMHDLGPWAPIAFVALYALATVLFVPGAFFGLAGGALFGPVWGTGVNLAGATLGASLAFFAARYVASDWVRRRAGARVVRLIGGVEAEGWRFVAFVRLVPLFPFNLVNYLLGLTRIPASHYILASLVCMLPGTLAFSWLGHAGRQALTGEATAIRHGLSALGVLASVAFVSRLLRRTRVGGAPRWIDAGELAQRLAHDAESIALIDVREPLEFAGALGHIGGARNLPLGELPPRLHELEGLREKTVVMVCHTDKRSAKAAAVLRDAGFGDVRVLRGGMVRWNEPGRSA